MELTHITSCFFLISLQISFTICTLSQFIDKFVTFSCQFSAEIEKFIPREEGRSKRSTFVEDPDFDDPEQIFTYLYPLAAIKNQDFQEGQRSSSAYHSNSIYAWVTDLGSIWLNSCRSQHMNEAPINRRKQSDVGVKRSPWINHPIENKSVVPPSRLIKLTNSNLYRSTRQYREVKDKKVLNITASTTTPAPDTTTTAAPSSDDNFFSSYGGDIEYFFPLISFGIPFDGEITFLGFHGFKGIFPYK